MKTEQHEFYCINCGKRGLDLHRSVGHQHEKFHRKKLYCFNCKEEINHIEIRNTQEREEFIKNFNEGAYKDEAEESLAFSRESSEWQKFLGKK